MFSVDKMDYDDPHLANLTVLNNLNIKSDVENEYQGTHLMENQSYGFGDSYSYDHSQHPSSSSNHECGQQMMEYTSINSNTRASISRPLTNQDAMKLEKKRERNRIAATKCRQRKIEKIQTLEMQVKQLQKENGSLAMLSQRLRQNVQNLESQINFHLRHGCQLSTQPSTLPSRDEQLLSGSHQTCDLADYVCATPTASTSSSPSPVQFGPDSTCLS